MSRPCEQCGQTKQCRMHLDRDGKIVYLCGRCAKDLNFTERATAGAQLTAQLTSSPRRSIVPLI